MRSLCLVVAAGLLPAAIASAEAPTIEHTAVKCIVAGRYPKLEAAFAPAPVARARSYFRPEGVPSWYYVEMTADASAPSAYAGVLPRPTKKLVGKTIDYYLEASSAAFDSGRTLEYAPLVVARPEECKEQPIAAYAAGPPAGVFPNLPEGFALAGSFPVAAVAIVGGRRRRRHDGGGAPGRRRAGHHHDHPASAGPHAHSHASNHRHHPAGLRGGLPGTAAARRRALARPVQRVGRGGARACTTSCGLSATGRPRTR